MSKVVWKFPLRWGDGVLSMPKHAKVVLVARDPASDYLAVWAIVNPEAAVETRTFSVIGTGFEVPTTSVHLGSLVMDDFVWHVFETTPERVLMAGLEAFR